MMQDNQYEKKRVRHETPDDMPNGLPLAKKQKKYAPVDRDCKLAGKFGYHYMFIDLSRY